MTEALAKVSAEDFRALLGTDVPILDAETGIECLRIKVSSVSGLAPAGLGNRAPFSVIFEGPAARPLDQGTYAMHLGSIGDEAVFIVPVGEVNGVRQYEAIFG